jgi:polysaccharide biosynthesis/export protein
MLQKINYIPSFTRARWPVLVLVISWLGGCALAPGMTMGTGGFSGSQSAKQNTSFSRSGEVTPGETPPPGALLAITPELISQQRVLRKTDLNSDVKGLFAEPTPYGIGPGDIINIVVWNHPELVLAPAGSTLTTDSSGLAAVGNGYNISPEGLIQFPLLGSFKIAGLTESEARAELARRLSKFIKDPQITLRVQAYRAGRVYVDGEVRTPGLQAINDIPMTLPEAISRAGGLTATADRATVAVTRKGATTVINMPQLATLGVNPSRIMLAAGDLVRVGSRDDTKIFVMGEVTKPVALPLRNGQLTLNEALGEAGGVNPNSGDPRQIYVVRSRSGDPGVVPVTGPASPAAATTASATPEIFHLDANSPAAYALAEGFELKSRDVVYVDPVPLVLWSRVINLILPSSQTTSNIRSTTN